MKWQASDFKSRFQKWSRPAALIYPCDMHEADQLRALKHCFDPLPIYEDMETQAEAHNTLVALDGFPDLENRIAFLENTAERCTSPETKHSADGMQSARHWVQRVDTAERMFRRLTDGYGLSLMFGERCHQYIRNRKNWRGISGLLLDIDVFRDEKHPSAPEPCFSFSELLERYPLLTKICSFILPSASSLYEGRPFKARGVVLFPVPITDQRVYRAFGDRLLGEIDCIPANVTKNPAAVGFGNTHNAPGAWCNDSPDVDWIQSEIEQATSRVLNGAKQRKTQQKAKAQLSEHYRRQRTSDRNAGENISAFIEQCDPVAEMVRDGLLTPGRGNEYRWHESEHARSCDILDGSIHIFSHSMQAASPEANINAAVGAHRFYLYQLSGLDMTQDRDKAKCRAFLFQRGYGSDPKDFARKQSQKGVRKPVKLKNLSRFEGTLETLDTAREFLQGFFSRCKRFFALRTDTGTGKSEAGVTYALTKRTVMSTLAGDLRDELVARSIEKGIEAYGYRGIRETEATADYLPCIDAERFEVLRDKGYNPYKWVCENCAIYTECGLHGYRSQPARAERAGLLAIPFPLAFLDPRMRPWAKMYVPKEADALILHDDIPLPSLFYEVRLSAGRLRQLRADWKDTFPDWWAESVLDAFINRDWERVAQFFRAVDPACKEFVQLQEALTHCIDPSTGAVVDPDDYIQSEMVDCSTVSACRQLPQVDKEGADVATLLYLFFDRYPRIADAPFSYDASTETFTCYLPPEPFLLENLRFGFASATLDENLIKRIFPSIEFHDTALTEWHKDAGFHQLRTNRNPRATVLNLVEKYNAAGEPVKVFEGLSTTGETYYQDVLNFIKAHPNEGHAVLSYKVLIAEKQSELEALGAVVGWFGNLAGLDKVFKGVTYFHILFSPEVNPVGIDGLAKQLFGNDADPLLRDADGELERTADGTYADARVQQCYDALVIGEVRQVIGRARLNLYGNQVLLWTSLFIDGFSNREGAVLFDEVDWEQSGHSLTRLREIVRKREQAERTADVNELVSVGVSERTAQRLTARTRKQQKADREAEILHRHAAGETQQQIKEALGVGLATVNRVLKQTKF